MTSPQQAIGSYWQKLDYLERQLFLHVHHQIVRQKQHINYLFNQLSAHNPSNKLFVSKDRLHHLVIQLTYHLQQKINTSRARDLTTLYLPCMPLVL